MSKGMDNLGIWPCIGPGKPEVNGTKGRFFTNCRKNPTKDRVACCLRPIAGKPEYYHMFYQYVASSCHLKSDTCPQLLLYFQIFVGLHVKPHGKKRKKA